MYLDDPLKRDFYAELYRLERWSTRTLQAKIDGMLYERTALSRKPAEVVRHELDALRNEDRVTPDLLFKDPYLLDFLGIRDPTTKKIWKTPSCAKWKPFCWNSVRALLFSRARSVSSLTMMLSTLTCSFTIAASAVWSLSI